MNPTIIGLGGIVFLLLLMACRMPVGFAMAVVGVLGISLLTSLDAALVLLSRQFYASLSSYTFTVIPPFVLMGFIAFRAGITRRLYETAYKLLGSLPGGLAMASTLACTGFAAICGSSTATAATIGAVALPEMKRYGYDPALSTGCLAAGGLIGTMIPPSLAFIVYGSIAEQSITKLFMAGILPGLLMSVLFMCVQYILVSLRPRLAPPGPRTTLKEKLISIPQGGTEVLLIFGVVMGGLFAGYFTPTEAGAVGAAAVFLVALVTKELSWVGLKLAILDTLKTSSMLYIIIAGAMIFARFMALSRIPHALSEIVTHEHLSPIMILCIMVLIYLILGCFMETISMVLLTIPIFLPTAINAGFDPIWFGVIVVLMMEIGAITPPVGINVYTLRAVAEDVPTTTIFRGIMPYIIALLACVVILTIFPQIALFLPSLL